MEGERGRSLLVWGAARNQRLRETAQSHPPSQEPREPLTHSWVGQGEGQNKKSFQKTSPGPLNGALLSVP